LKRRAWSRYLVRRAYHRRKPQPRLRLIGQWRELSQNYYGDFYPLTPWSRDDQVWIAWQLDRPEQGEGMVQAFRRHDSFYRAASLKLRGLEPNARYAVINLDAPATRQEITGIELMEKGMEVEIPTSPGAAVFSYSKVTFISK
jgi:alpha-galactosidase